LTRTRDPRGYIRVYLGKGHPYANSGGWQWEHRLLEMERLGRPLPRWMHVHHCNRVRDDNRPQNRRVRLASAHMAYHGRRSPCLAHRDELGRFRSLPPRPQMGLPL